MPEYSDIEREIGELSECDFRIVYVHWGNEFINYPCIDQKNLAHLIIDKGADMIIGMHPHVLQGFEIYKDKYIFYSLGNFVFNMPWEPTKYSAIVNVDFAGDQPSISWDYTRIGVDYFPHYLEENQVPKEFRFVYLNSLLQRCDENERYYSNVFAHVRDYRKANYRDIFHNIPKFKFFDLSEIVSDFIKRRMK